MSRRPVVLALLGGLLTTAAFAPIDFAPGVVLGPMLLLLALEGRPRRAALGLGWLFGLAHFVSAVWWVLLPTHVYSGGPLWSAVLLLLLLSAYLALFPALAAGVYRSCCPQSSVAGWLLVWPAAWLLGEFFRNLIFDGFPWFSLGYLATAWPGLLKLAAMFGIHGISVVFALLSGVLVAVGNAGWRSPLARWLAAGLVGFGLLLAVLPNPSRWTQPDGEPLQAVLVQANVPQDQKWLRGNLAPTLQLYTQLTEAAWPADLVVWPEVAIPAARSQVEEFFAVQDQLAKAAGGSLLAGVITRHQGQAYNTVYALGRASPQRYVKQHLVPFGEYVPAPEWARPLVAAMDLPFPDISRDLAGVPWFEVAGQRLAFSICFEDVFPQEVRAVSREAGLLVNVTNDAWFAGSGAPEQHLQIARLRAAESGRAMLRVANTGISALIDADGRIAEQLPWGERGLLRVEAQPRQGLTPYQRWGQWPLYLWLLISALVALRRRGGLLPYRAFSPRQDGRP